MESVLCSLNWDTTFGSVMMEMCCARYEEEVYDSEY